MCRKKTKGKIGTLSPLHMYVVCAARATATESEKNGFSYCVIWFE